MRPMIVLTLFLLLPATARAHLDVARAVAGEVGWEPNHEARLVVSIIRLRAERAGVSANAMARAYSQPLREEEPSRPWVRALPREGARWPLDLLPSRYRQRWYTLLRAVRGWMREPRVEFECGADHWAAPHWEVDETRLQRVDCGDTKNAYYKTIQTRGR